MKKKITILIPAHNEEKVLPLLFKSLKDLENNNKNFNWEFLFVDDGSRDKTLKLITAETKKNKSISYISLSRNFGKEIAIAAGLDNFKGDCLIIMDSDLQHPPKLIPEMIKLWQKGYKDVFAKRKHRKDESILKRIPTNIYYSILHQFSNIPVHENAADFRLLDKICVKALQKIREQNRSTKALYSWIGFNKKEIEYEPDPRQKGDSKYSFFKLLNLAIDGITSFTISPLRISTVLGFISCFISLIYLLVWVIIRTIIMGIDSHGWASTMSFILFFGSIQLISLGIIGEYLGRIFIETKNRPLYFIRDAHFIKRH
ncbi:MAG: glycosyltransferase family 2 protein [Bifidobacteriaceae bacterium]|nr:glycosyltransferase family 2 protein [Bifidobacteriaceae bacterium]